MESEKMEKNLENLEKFSKCVIKRLSMKMTQDEFHKIYKQYFRLVMKVVNGFVKDLEYSQDVCQEVFLKFAEKVDGLDLNRYGEWFAVNAKRRGIDFTRKSFCKYESLALLNDEGEDAEGYVDKAAYKVPGKLAGSSDLSNQMVIKEFTGKLFEDLAHKDPDWYEISIRMYVDGETDDEIAGALGITIGNLRTKRHRMKKWILDNYQNEYEQLP